MPVAGDDLRRNRLAAEPQRPEGELLDAGVGVGVGAHGARQLADPNAGQRRLEPGAPPAELHQPAEQLESEGRRLGVHAVRSADRRRVAVLLGPREQRGVDRVDVVEQDPSRVSELERQSRVDDVGRREPVVKPASVLTHLLGDGLGEREHVMVGAILDLADPGHVDAGPLAHGRDRVGRHDAQLGPARHRRDLNVQPPGEPALVRPDGAHGGTGIAGDQSGSTLSRREEVARRPRLVRHLIVSRRSTQMSRITRIVPTAVLTVAALALVAPAAQAKPYVGPSGGVRGLDRRPERRQPDRPLDPGRSR